MPPPLDPVTTPPTIAAVERAAARIAELWLVTLPAGAEGGASPLAELGAALIDRLRPPAARGGAARRGAARGPPNRCPRGARRGRRPAAPTRIFRPVGRAGSGPAGRPPRTDPRVPLFTRDPDVLWVRTAVGLWAVLAVL